MSNGTDIRNFINIVQQAQRLTESDDPDYCDNCGSPIRETPGGYRHEESWRDRSCPAQPERDQDKDETDESMIMEFDSTTIDKLVNMLDYEHLRGMQPLTLRHHAPGLPGNVKKLPNKKILDLMKSLKELMGEGTGAGLLALLNKSSIASKTNIPVFTEQEVETYYKLTAQFKDIMVAINKIDPTVSFTDVIEYFKEQDAGTGKYTAVVEWLEKIKRKASEVNSSAAEDNSNETMQPIKASIIGKLGNMRIFQHSYMDDKTNKKFSIVDLCTQDGKMIDIHHRLIASTNKTGDALKKQITTALKKLKSSEIQALEQHGFSRELIDKITWVDEPSPVMEDQPPPGMGHPPAQQVIHINSPGGVSPSMPPAQPAEDPKYKKHFEEMKITVIKQVAAQVVAQILEKEKRKLTDSEWRKYPSLMITPELATAVAHVRRGPYGHHYDEYNIQNAEIINMVHEHGNELASIAVHESAMYEHMNNLLRTRGYSPNHAASIARLMVFEGMTASAAVRAHASKHHKNQTADSRKRNRL